MAKPRVIVTRTLPARVEARLRDMFTVSLNHNDEPFGAKKLMQAMLSADAVLATLGDQLDERTILAMGKRRVQIVANFGVGVNHIDLEAAEDDGLVVTNTPGVLTDATADLAMTLILNVTRRTWEHENHLRAGQWTGFKPAAGLGVGLRGKTLGIVGYGRIGAAVAARAHFGFGMEIIYYNRSTRKDLKIPSARQVGSITELMRMSDVVSLHIPGGADTRCMISAEHIAAMKPGAYLVNTARGDVIDQVALILALKNKRIAGAGLDVYSDEPKVPVALIKMDNVCLLPHIGSATIEAREAMGMMAVDNLEAYFKGEDPPNALF